MKRGGKEAKEVASDERNLMGFTACDSGRNCSFSANPIDYGGLADDIEVKRSTVVQTAKTRYTVNQLHACSDE